VSLGSVLSSASSGLFVAQTQLGIVSDNIANVDTPGYVRKVVDQQSVSVADGGGVTTGDITRTVNQFLQQASLNAGAQAATSSIVSSFLDQAQSLFGDPTSSSGYFSLLDQALSSVSAAAQNSTSPASRDQAVSSLSSFLNQSSSISTQLQQLSSQADSQIESNVTQVNNLLSQISQLNTTIIGERATGGNSTGAENTQSGLINQLSSILGVTVNTRADGAVDIRAGDGSLLVSSGNAAQLSYLTSGVNADQIMVTQPGGSARALQPTGGVLKGLSDLRNTDIPAISAQLGEYVSQAVGQINAAHNASTAVPPPSQLTGRNTGLDLPTIVGDFSGKTNIAIVDPTGVLQTSVAIDFSAQTMSVDGGPPSAFTPSTFLTSLNAALGANGSASFTNGALSIQGNGGDGVSIADDPTTPARDAGQGFSQFFGLNDLIVSAGYPNPATGLQGTDPNGFNAGGVLTLNIRDATGAVLRQTSITTTGAGDMNALLAQLNSSAGVAQYGAYSLDANGVLTFTPNQPGVTVAVVGDTTQRGAGGPSISELFGLNPNVQGFRAGSFSIRPDIAANSMNLAMAQLDLTASVGQSALSVGDSRGGQLLANASSNIVAFNAAGASGAIRATLTNYAAQFSGYIAQSASTATSNQANAQAVANEADKRRASAEGVNLDQELINMTTYQQAYAASARLLQAVNQMFSVLMNIQ
jgi:flagellar hook-associated protein 1 FlgK